MQINVNIQYLPLNQNKNIFPSACIYFCPRLICKPLSIGGFGPWLCPWWNLILTAMPKCWEFPHSSTPQGNKGEWWNKVYFYSNSCTLNEGIEPKPCVGRGQGGTNCSARASSASQKLLSPPKKLQMLFHCWTFHGNIIISGSAIWIHFIQLIWIKYCRFGRRKVIIHQDLCIPY